MNLKTATYGAGCFWGVEAIFRKTEGVVDVAVGYAGGNVDNPTYKQVCRDVTGHAEVVEVKYDPEKVSYETLTKLFFALHDPTQVNRQGPDFGSQYRSVIFYHDDEQKQVAEKLKKFLDDNKKFAKPVATQIEEAPKFWRAEEYHQQYFEKNGLMNRCHVPGNPEALFTVKK